MMRSFFISLSKARWAQQMATGQKWAWRIASRWVAGQTIEDAIRVARELNKAEILVTLDHLGENTSNPQEAEQAAQEIIRALDAIEDAGVRSNVSIKLSQIGLLLDEDLCRKNFQCILDHANKTGNFVRIDMEDSTLTEATLRTYFNMRELGYDNLGVVIQAYLYRSEADIQKLLEVHGRVRLCKGAYKEPAQVAFPKKQDVDANYDRLARRLLEGAQDPQAPRGSEDGKCPPIPAVATHDPRRIAFTAETAEKLGLPKQAFEFQMLFGIRRDLQESLARSGYRVRVYVPFGTHWYPYLMRRLAERPANLWFVVKNLGR